MPRKEPQTLQEEWDELTKALHGVFDPVFVPLLGWIDRQLRRSPRLYRWLSK